MLRFGVLSTAVLGIALALPGSLFAQSTAHWYQPHYMSSVEEAANRLQFLSPHFAPMAPLQGGDFALTSGYSLERVDMNKLGINLSFTKSGVVQSTQYFWAWGGGYNAPVSTPYKDDIVTSIDYSDVAWFSILNWPKVKNYPATWCAWPYNNRTSHNDAICVSSEADAQELIDALGTLVVASGNSLGLPFGMMLDPIPEKELRKHPEQTGMLIQNVALEGPPAQAGIQSDDILHTVDGKPCTGTRDFGNAIPPEGGVVHVEVFRKGKPLSFDLRYPSNGLTADVARKLRQSGVELAQKNAPPATAAAAPPSGFRLGIQIRAVTDADVAPFGLAKARGIVVVAVEKDSLADHMGILPGDVILEVNNSEIGDAELFAQYVRGGAAKKFRVWRKGQALELTVPQSL